jgi:hypothetical protein
MKALAAIVLLPFLSVVILSLYEMGGAAKIAALVLLAVCLIGAVAGLFWKRSPNPDHGTKA